MFSRSLDIGFHLRQEFRIGRSHVVLHVQVTPLKPYLLPMRCFHLLGNLSVSQMHRRWRSQAPKWRPIGAHRNRSQRFWTGRRWYCDYVHFGVCGPTRISSIGFGSFQFGFRSRRLGLVEVALHCFWHFVWCHVVDQHFLVFSHDLFLYQEWDHRERTFSLWWLQVIFKIWRVVLIWKSELSFSGDGWTQSVTR